MATVIADEDEARILARRLVSGNLERPVVVISTQPNAAVRVDVDRVEAGVGHYADVAVMVNGPLTWAFAEAMPPQTQVYGAAARVYSVDRGWVTNPYASRLHIVTTASSAERAANELVADAMHDAARAGLLAVSAVRSRDAGGEVKGFAAGRAVVRGDFAFASVHEELTLPGVPLERILAVGMRVVGRLDDQSRVLDISAMLPELPMAVPYEIGAVVPVRVAAVTPETLTVEVLPGQIVEVNVGQVTGELEDDLTDVVSADDIVPARLIGLDPPQLSMLEVDEAEVREAAGILVGGPPWLALPELDERTHAEPEPEPLASEVAAGEDDAPPSVVVDSEAELAGMRVELDQVRMLLARESIRADKNERQVEHLRTQLRRAKTKPARRRVETPQADVAFIDPEQQLRHEVYLAWIDRVPAVEKSDHPLPDGWRVGPRFLESLREFPPETQRKALRAVVDALTGRDAEVPGRELHVLRTGAGGNDSPCERAPGEYCWRAAVERGAPQPARLHYWRAGTGIELSRVVRHDDMDP